MTSWGAYANRLRVGIDMAGNRQPTQANPVVSVSWAVYAQTNYSTYNYDLSGNWYGVVSGSATKRASNSTALLMGSGAFNVTASYDGTTSFDLGGTFSGTGAGPASWVATGTIARRPTANPSAPTNPAMVVSADQQVRVSWTNVTNWPGPSGGRHYRGQLSRNAGFTDLVNNSFWTNGGTISGLTRGQQYWMRVRAEANWWDATRTSAWSSVVTVIVPNAPTLASAPAATNISRNSWVVPVATVSNNGGQAPTNYRIMVNGTGPIDNTNISAAGSWKAITVGGATADHQYWYKVSAANAAGWGPWTAWQTVTTLDDAPSDPAAPVVSAITETSCTVTWVAPAANGATITGYDLVISDTSNPEVPVVAYRNLGVGVLSQAVTGLSKAKSYQAYVRALGTPASSGYSPPGEFVTAGTLATMFPKINDSGTWKDWELYERQGGVWKKVQLQLNDAGTWKWSEL